MLEIKIDRQPEQFLKKADKILFERLVTKIKQLPQNPVPHTAKRIVGYEASTFRIRVGDYRVLYRLSYEANQIIIVKIDKRSKVYD